MVLLHLFDEFLVRDDLQFRFKRRSSCSHALFAFSKSIKYFTSNRNKVYAAFLDASKAFDKVLHKGNSMGECLKEYVGEVTSAVVWR